MIWLPPYAAVASGNVYLQPALARWLIEDYQRLSAEKTPLPTEPSLPDSTSHRPRCAYPRERQVLEWSPREKATPISVDSWV